MGRHEGPPLGSAAREATAAPYIGKRRAPEEIWQEVLAVCPAHAIIMQVGWNGVGGVPCPTDGAAMMTSFIRLIDPPTEADADDLAITTWAESEPDDPPRCWSCGHRFGDGCECACCNDTHDGGPDDV